MYQPEELKINKDLEGMSLRSLQEHFKLYQGYVKKTNEIQEKLKTADPAEANGVYSAIGELKRQETFAVNGMKLHEVYFGHLTDGGREIQGRIKELLERDFGSLESWQREMMAAAMAARGWSITAYDLQDNKLRVYAADAQNVGAVWAAIPLICLDVYEHAYFMDHGANRKTYLEAFFKNINWTFVNELLLRYKI